MGGMTTDTESTYRTYRYPHGWRASRQPVRMTNATSPVFRTPARNRPIPSFDRPVNNPVDGTR